LSIAVELCVYVGDDLRDVQAGNARVMATILSRNTAIWAKPATASGGPRPVWIESPSELLAWIA
jgi:hypothetical protein